MNNGPTFVRLLGLFVGTSIAISLALGTGFGLVGVVTGVVLGVSIGTPSTIAVGSAQTVRSGFRLFLADLAPTLPWSFSRASPLGSVPASPTLSGPQRKMAPPPATSPFGNP